MTTVWERELSARLTLCSLCIVSISNFSYFSYWFSMVSVHSLLTALFHFYLNFERSFDLPFLSFSRLLNMTDMLWFRLLNTSCKLLVSAGGVYPLILVIRL